MPFCSMHLSPFFPLVQSEFAIIVLNSASGLILTFPLLEAACLLVLPKNACFIFPVGALDRDSFVPSWLGRRRIFPLLSVAVQVLLGWWIGRRMKWCCPGWLLCQFYYCYSTGCLMGSRALSTCSYKNTCWEESKNCTPVSQPFLLDLKGKLCNKIYDNTPIDFI